MAELVCPEVVVYLCQNCIPEGGRMPRQWTEEGKLVHVRMVPCSGKIDAQYLLSAMEGGVRGLCVVACPQGECRLAQGNYRAQVRVGTIQRLLNEIGVEPNRVRLLNCAKDESFERFEQLVREAVDQILALGKSPTCDRVIESRETVEAV